MIDTAAEASTLKYVCGILTGLLAVASVSLDFREKRLAKIEEQRAKAATPHPASVTKTLTPNEAGLVSIEALAKRIADLDGRFAERDVFLQSAIGKRVQWKGRVIEVSTLGEGVILQIASLDRTNFQARFTASFPAKFRDRLFALRKEDSVAIDGTIRSSISVDVVGDGITVDP